MMEHKDTLVVDKLKTYFFTEDGIVKAVDDVSFHVGRGEVLGLVGESGSGKSVTGFSILGLVDPPGKITDGKIIFKGTDIAGASEKDFTKLRGARIAMIFQDPMMTLNPVLRIDTQLMEAILAHEKVSTKAARDRSLQVLELVGISSAKERLKAYPHQFSGGMRQRVAIATAILNKPDLIIADEPTTALDVTIQSQIINVTQNLCQEYGTSLIWITHDLTVIAGLADRICVMYAGKIVEQGDVDDVLDRPKHPYTKGLIGSVPSRNKKGEPLQQIRGMTPSLLNTKKGCLFAKRCDYTIQRCFEETPEVSSLPTGQLLRCFNL